MSARRGGWTGANGALSSDAGCSQAGRLVGLASALRGDLLGTGALLVLHPEWIFPAGEGLLASLVGLVIAWGVAVVVALIFIPALTAAITLWLTASVNR
jgi:hypothetical protein